jgi:hypothetical protein
MDTPHGYVIQTRELATLTDSDDESDDDDDEDDDGSPKGYIQFRMQIKKKYKVILQEEELIS